MELCDIDTLETPTVKTWWEEIQDDVGYDSDELGSRPVKFIWPKDSLLTPDHFTIDQQPCLKCKKKLGYALPMNKEPNVHFLFCCEEDGSPKCRLQSDYLNCWACGNFNTQSTGAVVSHPANCAYLPHPTQIYDYMCYHCHKEMMENEPGIQECRDQMKKIRQIRREDKLKGGGGGGSSSYSSLPFGMREYDAPNSNFSFSSSLLPETHKKRKRAIGAEEEKCAETETFEMDEE